MELGFDVFKTKKLPYWHKKDGPDGPMAISIGDDDDEDKDATIAQKKEYPVLTISDAPEELYDYPEEGTCVIKYKIERRAMIKQDDEKPHYTIEMSVTSIEPKEKPSKPNGRSPMERAKESAEAYNRASRK